MLGKINKKIKQKKNNKTEPFGNIDPDYNISKTLNNIIDNKNNNNMYTIVYRKMNQEMNNKLRFYGHLFASKDKKIVETQKF